MVDKLTPDQHRRISEIEEYLTVVGHVKHLVTELEGNRAAPTRVIQSICEKLARELSQMRHRVMAANLGTVGDIAGAMAVMAARGGGLNLKIRGLQEGVQSLTMQLEHALKAASTPEPKRASEPRA